MIKFIKLIWAVYFLILFAVFFLLFYPLFVIFLRRERYYPYAHKLRRIWGRILMLLSGLFPSTTYDEKLPKLGTYVFVANHFSYLDILSVNVQMPYYFNFMAKSELAKIPLFGIFFRTIDIPVERKSIKGAKLAFEQACQRLADGISILNFPEGGISKTIPKMRDFKMGPFKMAIEQGVPIVPVTIADNWKRLPDNGVVAGGMPGRMRMHIHAPIDTADMNVGDEIDLSRKVYSIIENKFNELNKL